MYYNLTNYSLNAFETGKTAIEINVNNVIKDFVYQINDKIVLALFLFGISYFLSLIVLPRSILGMEYLRKMINVPVFDVIIVYFKKLLNFLISLFETFCLGCCVFVLYIAYIQNLLYPYMKLVIFGLLFVLILIFLLKMYSYIKNKKYQEDSKKLESIINNGN